MMNVVLLEPEIPQNVGNIGRTCVATGTALHLIRPLGFQLDDKLIRRAGLDYWQDLNLVVYDDIQDFRIRNSSICLYMASTKAGKTYSQVSYAPGDFIMFGRESAGIPEDLLSSDFDHALRIPMLAEYRSLNLSSSVAVVLYEALRQQNFPGLLEQGRLL